MLWGDSSSDEETTYPTFVPHSEPQRDQQDDQQDDQQPSTSDGRRGNEYNQTIDESFSSSMRDLDDLRRLYKEQRRQASLAPPGEDSPVKKERTKAELDALFTIYFPPELCALAKNDYAEFERCSSQITEPKLEKPNIESVEFYTPAIRRIHEARLAQEQSTSSGRRGNEKIQVGRRTGAYRRMLSNIARDVRRRRTYGTSAAADLNSGSERSGSASPKKKRRKKEEDVGYYCRICNKYYERGSSLIEHSKYHQEGVKMLICRVCGKPFQLPHNLNLHIRDYDH